MSLNQPYDPETLLTVLSLKYILRNKSTNKEGNKFPHILCSHFPDASLK
jgi:hypothetical protein